MKTLDKVKVGEKVAVTGITGDGPIKRRIMDMGITRGTEIFVRKYAPMGDPMELNLRGYELSLRKKDASIIQVD
jgi:ferrous iron transport protein A